MADEEAAAEEADSATWTKGPTVDFARELEGQTEEAGSFRARGRRVFLTLAGLEPTYATLISDELSVCWFVYCRNWCGNW